MMGILPRLLVVLTLLPGGLPAQIMASERATMSQVIDGTTISMEFSRPRLRGRDPASIFAAEEIPAGEVWTPGANTATLLRVDRDVTINGVAVPAGAYSVWMAVDSTDSWLTALKTDTTLFHMAHPPIEASDLQFRVPVDRVPPTDALTWGFGTPRSTGITVELRWADRRVGMDIVVQPSLSLEFPAAKAGALLGNYAVALVMQDPDDPEWGADFDTTMTITHRGGRLWANWYPWFYPLEEDNLLVSLTDEWFTFGMMLDGELFEVETWMTFEFTLEDGRATGFEVRMSDDAVLFRGTRVD